MVGDGWKVHGSRINEFNMNPDPTARIWFTKSELDGESLGTLDHWVSVSYDPNGDLRIAGKENTLRGRFVGHLSKDVIDKGFIDAFENPSTVRYIEHDDNDDY